MDDYSLLKRRVQTPKGEGVVVQVFGDRVTVKMDSPRTKKVGGREVRLVEFFKASEVEVLE